MVQNTFKISRQQVADVLGYGFSESEFSSCLKVEVIKGEFNIDHNRLKLDLSDLLKKIKIDEAEANSALEEWNTFDLG